MGHSSFTGPSGPNLSVLMHKLRSYDQEQVLAICRGEIFGGDNATLPLPNMLMVDRITRVTEDGGNYGKGLIVAELDIIPQLWFFACHFPNDPVMPGCLGLDAMWQLLGFYLVWKGFKGKGRALGVGEVKFRGQILPSHNTVSYHIHIKRIINRQLTLGVADGVVAVDGRDIYFAKDMRAGLFTSTEIF